MDPKDLVIEHLRTEVATLKDRLSQNSFENLTDNITQKDAVIEGLKSRVSELESSVKSEAGGDGSEHRMKNIILQSKVSKLKQELDKMNKEKEDLEFAVIQAKKNSTSTGELTTIKRQLHQEMETSDRLRNQLNRASLNSGGNAQMQQEIQNLRYQLQQAQGGEMGMGNPQELEQLQNQIQIRDQKIAELRQQLDALTGDEGAGGPMANLRLRREINALKSQLEMIKRSESEMRKKYEQQARKSEFSFDDGW